VLFLCYDENDGLFDHIVPPMPPSSNERNSRGMVSPSLAGSFRDEFLDLDVNTSMIHPLVPGADPGGRQPLGLGMRVPMIVISPWTTGGWVCSQTFDHTSILQFLEARFGVAEPNISAWRRSICGDLTSAFDFGLKPDLGMPNLPLPAAHPDLFAPIIAPAIPSMPMQEDGLRPARPIPYQWQLEHRLDLAAGRLWLDFRNSGAAGAGFYAYDRTAPASAPRRYTIAAAEGVREDWPLHPGDIAYDILVHGPNGYLCHARGELPAATTATVEVRLIYQPERCQIQAILSNTGSLACSAFIHDAYVGYLAELPLKPGATMELTRDLSANHGWHDISVTLDTSDVYLRRFAGHLETGRPGTSDPMLSPSLRTRIG
jgi:phospholipase C